MPEYAIHWAHQLQQLAAIGPKVQIVRLEALVAAGLVFEATERGRAIPDVWQALIPEYNRGLHGDRCPEIILEWSSLK